MDEWIKNPALRNLDPLKLEIMQTVAKQTRGKSGRELAPIMMALITSANKKGIHFTPQETHLIIDIMKEGKTQEEKDQLDRMFQMVTKFIQKGTDS